MRMTLGTVVSGSIVELYTCTCTCRLDQVND